MEKVINKINDNELLLEVDRSQYEFEAILNASYKFTDRCYIHTNKISEDAIGVYFKKKEDSDTSLELIADNFCNELIDQQLRIFVEKRFGRIRDEIVKKAFSPIN